MNAVPLYAALNADPEVARYLGGPLTGQDSDDVAAWAQECYARAHACSRLQAFTPAARPALVCWPSTGGVAPPGVGAGVGPQSRGVPTVPCF